MQFQIAEDCLAEISHDQDSDHQWRCIRNPKTNGISPQIGIFLFFRLNEITVFISSVTILEMAVLVRCISLDSSILELQRPVAISFRTVPLFFFSYPLCLHSFLSVNSHLYDSLISLSIF
ncbi:MAG: hypothetical protein EGR88_07775 [Ruminococcus sp. SR1/5]|nr:hypothetical protein [Ruminococcus sp.]